MYLGPLRVHKVVHRRTRTLPYHPFRLLSPRERHPHGVPCALPYSRCTHRANRESMLAMTNVQVYDITSVTTFGYVGDWICDVRRYSGRRVCVHLCAPTLTLTLTAVKGRRANSYFRRQVVPPRQSTRMWPFPPPNTLALLTPALPVYARPVNRYAPNVPVVLLGRKCHLEQERQISKADGQVRVPGGTSHTSPNADLHRQNLPNPLSPCKPLPSPVRHPNRPWPRDMGCSSLKSAPSTGPMWRALLRP